MTQRLRAMIDEVEAFRLKLGLPHVALAAAKVERAAAEWATIAPTSLALAASRLMPRAIAEARLREERRAAERRVLAGDAEALALAEACFRREDRQREYGEW